MTDKIRRITNEDFKEVSELFKWDKDNSIEELKWLFSDPSNSNTYNAFVAINSSNIIIGVIGYILSSYYQGERDVTAVLPISWMLHSDYKGIAGVSLFRKVSEFGNIGIIMGGSHTAQKLFPLFKYKSLGYTDVFYKILNIPNYYIILKRKSFLKKLGMFCYLLPSYFQSTSKKLIYKDIYLIPYDYKNFVKEKDYKDIFKRRVTKNNIDWLLSCPSLKTFGFFIKKGKNSFYIII